MPSVGSFALLSSFGMASAAAAAAANPLEPVTDVIDAALGAVQDVSGYVLGSPRTAADIIIWVIEFGRGIPGLAKAVFQGDTATQDKLCNFAVFAAASVFVVYASLAALNLFLLVACSVKNGVAKYLVLPNNLPAPLSTLRDLVQKQLLDRIIGWKVNSTFIRLDGQGKSPSLASVASSMSAAISACMLLSCAPAVLSLMRGGANKGEAEAIAWTVGTALGIQYLVNKVAD